MNAFPSSEPEWAAVERFLGTIDRLDPPMSALLEEALDHAQAYRTRLQTPVRIAFAGKSSSGKSSLVNLLIGEPVLPTGKAAAGMPSTLVRHARTERTIASWWDRPGQAFEGRALDAAKALGPDFIVLEVDCEALEGLSLVDIAGFDDTDSSKRAVFTLMRLADVMLWCSRADNPAIRAESDSWKMVPARLIRNSMLVLTHAEDVSEDDIEGAKRKLTPERLKGFRQVVPISTRVAQMALADPGQDFDSLWKISGAAQLVDEVIGAAVSVREAELERIRKGIAKVITPAQAELDRLEGTKGRAAAVPPAAPAVPVETTRAKPVAPPEVPAPVAPPPAAQAGPDLWSDWSARMRSLIVAARNGTTGEGADFVMAIQTEVDGFRDLLEQPGNAAGSAPLADEFERASDLLTLLQFEAAEVAEADAAAILLQLTDSARAQLS